MALKNPYNLVEKANNTFNLYLDKYDEIEDYMHSSEKELAEIKELFNLFLEKYTSHQNNLNNINYKFLELLEKLVQENQINKKLISNLESKITELTTKSEVKSENIMNLFKNTNAELNNSLDHVNNEMTLKFDEINAQCIANHDLVNEKSNKYINNISKLTCQIDELYKEINQASTEQLQNINEINNTLANVNKEINAETKKQTNNLSKLTTQIGKEINAETKKQTNNLSKLTTQIEKEIKKEINNNTNKQIEKNIYEINNTLINVNEEINAETKKQTNNLSKLTTQIGKEIKKEINNNSNKQIENINNFYLMQKDFNTNSLEYQTNIKQFLDSQKDINDNLNNAIKLFTQNYEECKTYFFNNNENELKKHLNTDELFRLCYFNNIQFLSFSPTENRILLKTKDDIILGTNNRFYTIKEVIGFDGYSVPQLYHFDEFVVFDIGMNRAYASLRFAKFDNCSRVYGFEIDENTYDKAIDNINYNNELSKKITAYNFGLSNKNDTRELYYLPGADGLNTLSSDFLNIQYELRDNKDKIQKKTVKVKKASEVIGNIIKKENIKSNIVLKVDTEGSEYEILDDLIESGLINKIDLILGEGHNFNNRNITEDLSKLGYKEIENKDNVIVYNFAFVKEKYYNIWPLRN